MLCLLVAALLDDDEGGLQFREEVRLVVTPRAIPGEGGPGVLIVVGLACGIRLGIWVAVFADTTQRLLISSSSRLRLSCYRFCRLL